MNIAKILYWIIFICILLSSLYLQYEGHQAFGIRILLFLGFFHLIVFVIAIKDFMGIRSKIMEGVELIIKVMGIVAIIIFTILIISIVTPFFLLGKMLSKPREFFKTFQ